MSRIESALKKYKCNDISIKWLTSDGISGVWEVTVYSEDKNSEYSVEGSTLFEATTNISQEITNVT